MAYRALLVDDERLARKHLRTLLAEFPEVDIVAEASCVSEALIATREQNPDIVFLDIQMPNSSGFDFLEKAEPTFATIFVTAYDQFALRAFEVNGLDYLLKPVDSPRLMRAIRRLSLVRTTASSRVFPPFDFHDYLFVSNSVAARFIQIKRIKCIVAAGPYSEVFIDDGSQWMMLRTMKEWQERLPHSQFATIHRSTIINLDFVVQIKLLPNHSYSVTLRDFNQQLLMSRRRALLLKERTQ